MLNSIRTSKSVWTALFFALTILALGAGQVYGQQAGSATISGTATDASGAALVGAKVQATDTATNSSRSTTSDSTGRYVLASLPVGTYDVQASQTGFQTVVHTGVVLAVGSSVVVDFSLPVGQVTRIISCSTCSTASSMSPCVSVPSGF